MFDWTCFMFGHSMASDSLQPMIDRAVSDFYSMGFRIFIVGQYGNFDRMARVALCKLKKKHDDVALYLLIPYHPSERKFDLPEEFDFSYYPDGMEKVPKKLCIVRANEYMISHCDGIICYARYPGNARNLFEKISKKTFTRNIAWEEERKEGIFDNQPSLEETINGFKEAAGVE